MQHVNDDMDELFRRAGEEYPLDTRGADWEKISRALGSQEPEKPVAKKINRNFLWLLLLLPFSFLCNRYIVGEEGTLGKEMNPDPVNSAGNPSSSSPIPSPSGEVLRPATGTVNRGSKTPSSGKLSDFMQGGNAYASLSGGGKNSSNPDGRLLGKVTVNHTGISGSKHPSGGNGSYGTDQPETEKSYVLLDLDFRPYPAFTLRPSSRNRNIVDILPKRPDSQKPEKKFYAGMVGGISTTTVKFQKSSEMSYDVGLLAGYRISKKWSIESGLLYGKKYYYSKGEYFNTSKIYMPSNSEITYVEGYCNMWEFPLNIRYNIATAPRHTWFAKTGISSYLMKNESYDCMYYYPATGQSYMHTWPYNGGSRHWLSNLNLSAGYTSKIGKLGDLRIEPYIKIPLKGVGVGSMPLQSAGIHLGLTKEF